MAQEIRSLTGIRGLAVAWVVLHHVEGVQNGHQPGSNIFSDHGYLAVDLFFILSGFVMALAYSGTLASGWTWQRYRSFMTHRLARIYPLFLLTTLMVPLLIVLGLSRAFPVEALPAMLINNILMVQAWGWSESLNGPSWSISTEFAAYILFPLLASLALKPSRLMVACLTFITALIFIMNTHAQPTEGFARYGLLDIYWPYSPASLIRCLCEFFVGVVCWRLCQNANVRHAVKHPAISLLLPLILLSTIYLPVFGDLLFVAVLPLLILCLANESSLLARFIAQPILFGLGTISYSIYMLHAQLLRLLTHVPALLAPHVGAVQAHIIAQVMFYSLLLVGSTICYFVFEKPCRRLLRRFDGTKALEQSACHQQGNLNGSLRQ